MTTYDFRKGAVLILSLLIATAGLGGCSKADDASSTAAPEVQASANKDIQREMKAETASDSAKTPLNGVGPGAPRTTLAGYRTPNTAPVVTPRQVIRKADLDIRVKNVEKSEKTVSSIVTDAGGYTESATSTDLASDHPVLKISLRVPVSTFDSTISKFETLGVRLSKTIGSEDVTGKIVDLDAQLKTLTAQEEVYRNMLRGRTQLEEVFNIQQQLTSVRTQIEEITAQRKSAAGLAALSTISLTLEQDSVVSQPPSDPNWMTQSWAGATSASSSALRVLTVILMWTVAFSPFWIPVILILRKALRGNTRSKGPVVETIGS